MTGLFPHHAATLERAIAYFRRDAEVSAILLAGSIAHGFASEGSDVDLAIVVSDEAYERRAAAGELAFSSTELATYDGGYVDAKYVCPSFLTAVEQRGSEPARYAFAHVRVVHGDATALSQQLARIARYPREEKAARIARFCAQLQAWHWYATQAKLRADDYLMNLAAVKLTLFAGRVILAHNELLYPFHKWFMRVLAQAPDKPVGFMDALRGLNREPTAERATELYELVRGFPAWQGDTMTWPDRFMRDTELPWLEGRAPVEDL